MFVGRVDGMNKGYEIYVKNGRRIVKGLGHYETQPVYDCRELVKKVLKSTKIKRLLNSNVMEK